MKDNKFNIKELLEETYIHSDDTILSYKELDDELDDEEYNIFCVEYKSSAFEHKDEKRDYLEKYILSCINKYDEYKNVELIKDMLLFILLIPTESPKENFFNHIIERINDDLLTFEKKVSLILKLGKEENVKNEYIGVLMDYGIDKVKKYFPRAIDALKYSFDDLVCIREFLTREAEKMLKLSDEDLLLSNEDYSMQYYRGRTEAKHFLEYLKELDGYDENIEKLKAFLETWTIPKIVEHFSKTIIGQDAAKLSIAYAVTNHIERLCYPELNLQAVNTLLIGDSGTGKTKLWELVKEILPDSIVPLHEVYTPAITVAGFQGEELLSVLYSLYKTYGENADNAIVIFDEADKALKSNYSSTNNIDYGKQLQSELLQVIQGISHITKEHSVINTCNMMFVFCGAFQDMDRTSNTEKKCGFEYINPEVKDIKEKEVLERSLENYGFIPEFLARITSIVEMEKIDLEAYERILLDSDLSPIREAKKKAQLKGLSLTFTDESIKMIAKTAKLSELDLGVRQLRRITESVMKKKITEAAYNEAISEIVVDEDDISNYGT